MVVLGVLDAVGHSVADHFSGKLVDVSGDLRRTALGGQKGCVDVIVDTASGRRFVRVMTAVNAAREVEEIHLMTKGGVVGIPVIVR